MLVASDETGIFNLYAVDIATGGKTALTNSSDSSFANSYFPNDGRVIYNHDSGGDELNHVYVMNEDGTETYPQRRG